MFGDLITWDLFLPLMGIHIFWWLLIMLLNGQKLFQVVGADHNTSIKMLKEVIFPRFGVPRYLMTDGGSHFIHGAFRKMLAKYDVNHRIASPYHPRSSGQVELINREIKLILQKTVKRSQKNWSKKLDDAL